MRCSLLVPREQGFSIIEVMVAIGISSVAIVGISSLLHHMNKSVTVTEGRMAKLSLATDVRQLLSEKNTCLKSFVTGSLPIVAVSPAVTSNQDTQIQLPNNEVVGANATTQAYGGLRTAQLQLRNWQQPVERNGKRYYTTTLVWRGATKALEGRVVAATDNKTDRFALREQNIAQVVFETDMLGRIESCFAVNPDFDINNAMTQLCESFGGTVSNDGKCSMDSLGGQPCPNGPNTRPPIPQDVRCYQALSEEVTYNDVPATEKNQYMWMCRNAWNATVAHSPYSGTTLGPNCWSIKKQRDIASDPSVSSGTWCEPAIMLGSGSLVLTPWTCQNGKWIAEVSQDQGGGDGPGGSGGASGGDGGG